MRPLLTSLFLVLASCPCAFALNPALDISQYAHMTWRVRDGFVSAAINAIAQTPDGYLWIGTDAGLYRFDGVRAVAWQAPPNQTLPSPLITSLLAGRDGTLWIGTHRGVASWKDGTLREYRDFSGHHVGQMVEARDGSLWVSAAALSPPAWTLCAIRNGRGECYGADGGPGRNVIGLYEDSHGTLWAATNDGVWQWQPLPRRFYPVARQPDAIQGMSETDDGTLVISMIGGLRRLRDGRAELTYPFPRRLEDALADSVLRDRDGGIWIGTSIGGLVHVHQGITDVFAQVDGLSGDAITQILEDREGNIWVATRDGLDRFRDQAAASFSARQGLSNSRVQSVLAARDGSVWLGTVNDVNRLSGRRVMVYRGLPFTAVASLFEDRRRRVWISTAAGVGYVEDDRFVAVRGLPGGVTRAIAEDSRHLWVANQDSGLYALAADGTIVQRLAWSTLNKNAMATAMVADPSRPGVWLGFAGGGIINLVDGQIRASYGASDGLADGFVRGLSLDGDNAVWVMADGGLSRVHNGRVSTWTRQHGLPCDAAQWMVADAQSLWLGMSCGLVRIARSGIDRRSTLQTTVFGIADGVRLYTEPSHFTAPAAVSADGRIWFKSQDGVSVIDPRDLPFNKLPPPVHIEQITADRKTYDASAIGVRGLRLPPLTRDLQIDYTALSFVAPEKMQFRYMLEGRDRDWQAVGTRRHALYDSLRPGSYRFHVIASNNDGAWNEAGATVDFVIAPAYYQTTWFLALSAGLLVAVIWSAHRVRLRIVEKHEREITALNERMMKAQEQERMRIAGELHDGVMQEMLAVTMMLGTAKRRIADVADAKAAIDKVQDKLIKVGTDIRQISHDLHPPVLQEAGLPGAMHSYCDQFGASSGMSISCEADESVRDLSRGAALALFRVLQEAIGNAAKHAGAKQITVRLTRSGDTVSLAVSDDGAGFDPSHLGTAGGLGLIMMRERATQLNGTFEFESAPGRGTTIRVEIPFR